MTGIILFVLMVPVEYWIINLIVPRRRANRIVFAFLLFTQLAMVSGFRHRSIYNDSEPYASFFEDKLKDDRLIDKNERFEPGFQIYTGLIARHISNSYVGYFIISALIIVGIFIRFMYKYSGNVWLSVFLALTSGFFVSYVCLMRQAIAVAIWLLAVECMLNNKKIWTFICIALAISFHFSAIILLPFYFVRKLSLSKRNVYLFLLAAVIPTLLFAGYWQSISLYYSNEPSAYLDNQAWNTGAVLMTIYTSVLVLSMLFNNGLQLAKKNELLKIFMWAGLFILFISIAGMSFLVLKRFVNYFMPLLFAGIPVILNRQSVRRRHIWEIMLCSLSFAVLFITLIYRPEWYHIIPYKFYWQ